MSPVPLQLIGDIGRASDACSSGDLNAGRALARDCVAEIKRLAPAMTRWEQLQTLAYAATACMRCSLWADAVSLLERVCSLASQDDPDSTETARDFYDLGMSYAALERWDRAHQSLQESRRVFLAAGAADDVIAHIESQVQMCAARVNCSE